MRRKKCLSVLLAALALTGCSLAQPERAAGGGWHDRPVGIYVVRYESREEAGEFYRNPYLEEYGSFTAQTEFGALDFPEEVLMGEYDEEERTYRFPGLKEGWGLFALQGTDADGEAYNTTVCDMESNGTSYHHLEDGERVELEGTIYIGPPTGAGGDREAPDSDSIWQFYRAYQAEDGRVYLSGHGDSTNGGSGWSYGTESSTSTTRNGETTTQTVKTTVHIEAVRRLEGLSATWFDGKNAAILVQELSPAEKFRRLSPPAGAQWVLIEEHYVDGRERTAYTLPRGGEDDPVVHGFVVLDETGTGSRHELAVE